MYLSTLSPRKFLPPHREPAKASLAQTMSPAGATTATGRAKAWKAASSSPVSTRFAERTVVEMFRRYSTSDTSTASPESTAAVPSTRNRILL